MQLDLYPLYSVSYVNAGKRAKFALPLAQFAWVARTMYPLARVGTRAGTPLYSASLGQPGQFIYLPVLVLVLVPLVQCFAWSARAMNLFARVLCVNRCTVCTVLVSLVQCFAWTARAMYLLARGRTRTGVRTGNVPTCPCSYSYWYLLCSALLDSTGNVPTCPCSYSYWYLLCSASLGQHGQYT